MKQARGIGVSTGVAIGTAFVYDPELHISDLPVPEDQVEEEVARLEAALTESAREITKIKERIEGKLGPETAGIFSYQLFVLEDPEFRGQTVSLIENEL